MDLVDIHRWL